MEILVGHLDGISESIHVEKQYSSVENIYTIVWGKPKYPTYRWNNQQILWVCLGTQLDFNYCIQNFNVNHLHAQIAWYKVLFYIGGKVATRMDILW